MADSNHYMTGSPIFCSNLRNRRNPSNSNYHMSINNCQAIQKSCKDREYKAWFTLGSESRFHTYIPRLCVKARLLITTVFERKKKQTRLTRNSGNLLLCFMANPSVMFYTKKVHAILLVWTKFTIKVGGEIMRSRRRISPAPGPNFKSGCAWRNIGNIIV